MKYIIITHMSVCLCYRQVVDVIEAPSGRTQNNMLCVSMLLGGPEIPCLCVPMLPAGGERD